MVEPVKPKYRTYKDVLEILTSGQKPVSLDDHLKDVAIYGQAATIQRAPVQTSLSSYTDAELIMDMIRRGYAVMKLPEGGGPPDVLREE